MSALEIFAAVLGVANVYLITRRSLWNWPVGIALTILYTWIFFDAKLYADTVTQIFFTVVQIIGWMQWHYRKVDEGEIKVVQPDYKSFLMIGAMVFTWMVSWWFFATYTDASYPFWDSLILGASVVGQFLLNWRRIESWVYWIAVDFVGIPLYWVKGLYPTSGLYVVFLGLAIYGLIEWYKKGERQRQEAIDNELVLSVIDGMK